MDNHDATFHIAVKTDRTRELLTVYADGHWTLAKDITLPEALDVIQLLVRFVPGRNMMQKDVANG